MRGNATGCHISFMILPLVAEFTISRLHKCFLTLVVVAELLTQVRRGLYIDSAGKRSWSSCNIAVRLVIYLAGPREVSCHDGAVSSLVLSWKR